MHKNPRKCKSDTYGGTFHSEPIILFSNLPDLF